ncbi:divalent-cation tolerance protein CutA [Rickettsiales endosymbiont of Peranema trichophorum]|uniref:divalent-cation tolerance protein CutA n=1 Tax=Rickettsiales endosymbiont of Peranema trichophorum TaxID=2486577 RepID=UPI0010233D1D|nr:divalent-cation tolerance protein CutA [Rickettsiales endosymbiont of Peranema trichophorum]RZI46338.1 divalent-cation tolerance protein CutA [Rickettsiales endosymbiont of Peranema trichophorum]
MEAVVLYVPCSNKSEAVRIAEHLVGSRLAGCVNIIDNVTSIYRWNDTIERSQECLLIAKTTKELVKAASDDICKIHSYTTPCIAEISLSGLNEVFGQWLIGALGDHKKE